jgi:hypothetical protein
VACSFKQKDYTLAKGTTKVLSTAAKTIEFDIVNEKVKTTAGAHAAMKLAQSQAKDRTFQNFLFPFGHDSTK